MASELKNLLRKLEWSDYTPKATPQPGPGVAAPAAETIVDYTYSGVKFNTVAGSNPAVYRLADTVTVTIRLKPYPASWKATWLPRLPKSQQDSLLNHERGHYRLGALMYRDLFVEVMYLKGQDYPSEADGEADFKTILKRYSRAVVQEVHDTYDAPSETDHKPYLNRQTQAAQAKWEGFFDKAVKDKAPLFHVLAQAGYTFTESRPDAPVVVPIPFK
jgi:hypothetical protein